MINTTNTTNYPIFRAWEKYLALFCICITGIYSWHTARLVNYHALERHRQHLIDEANTAKARDGYKEALKKSLKKLTQTTKDGINSLWYFHAATAFLMCIQTILIYLQLGEI